MQPIYLDNNSTTHIDPAVAESISVCLAAGHANPASQHRPGQAARQILERIRVDILQNLGAVANGLQADSLVFTSGGTESNNLALIGLAFEPDGSLPPIRRILVSAIEHPSVTGTVHHLASRGFQIESIAVDSNGVVDLEDLQNKLEDPVRLVSVMLANNETGVIQPVERVVEIAGLRGALVHTDAVQAVGKIKVNFARLNVDAMAFSAHKFHGPRNVGGLLLRHQVRPYPVVFGGFQQAALRPGTEDVCGALGMREALRQYCLAAESRHDRMQSLRNLLQREICDKCADVTVIGVEAARVPHTLNVAFRGINRQEFLMAADMNGLAISTGSACASGSSERSPVLMAMGLDHDVVDSSIRISLSAQTTALEIDLAAERIIKIANDLRR